MGDSEADKLEKSLAEKAKQDQEKQQEPEPLSASISMRTARSLI